MTKEQVKFLDNLIEGYADAMIFPGAPEHLITLVIRFKCDCGTPGCHGDVFIKSNDDIDVVSSLINETAKEVRSKEPMN